MRISVNNKVFEIGELYQPLYGLSSDPKRSCTNRWNSIMQADAGYNDNGLLKGTVTDWGCSLGWFSFKIAEMNGNQINAIDFDINNIKVCNELKHISGYSNINFIHGIVPKDIPEYTDSHIILSILHHFQQNVLIPDNVVLRIQDSKVIYLELAHCNEYPAWSGKLIPENSFISPFHYLKKMLELQFPDFTVRMIGVHSTHLGSVRPMFQLKKHISEHISSPDFTGIIYDRFTLPYIDFGDFSLNSDGSRGCPNRMKQGVSYAFAVSDNGNRYFLKMVNGNISRKVDYIDGFLLNDIIKFGMLPYYDRYKIKTQIARYKSGKHLDPHPWNFMIMDDSTVIPIDYDDEKSSISADSIDAYMGTLLQLL